MTTKGTWKQSERRIAAFFGTMRTILSGGNSRVSRSDSIHDKIFIEAKYRHSSATHTLYDETKKLAQKEKKVPVLALVRKRTPGFLIVVHCDDFDQLIAEYLKGKQQ